MDTYVFLYFRVKFESSVGCGPLKSLQVAKLAGRWLLVFSGGVTLAHMFKVRVRVDHFG